MAGALACTYVSLFEGFGIPILEGFSAGVPVICSNVSSMPEVAVDAGYLLQPDDVSSIANAMIHLSKDQALRQSLISKGTNRLVHFSWDRSARQTYDVLVDLAKSAL